LCDDAVVRTRLDASDEARDRTNALQTASGSEATLIVMSDYGFPVFHCTRRVTPEDVKELEDYDA
jgi:hypothetical protein